MSGGKSSFYRLRLCVSLRIKLTEDRLTGKIIYKHKSPKKYEDLKKQVGSRTFIFVFWSNELINLWKNDKTKWWGSKLWDSDLEIHGGNQGKISVILVGCLDGTILVSTLSFRLEECSPPSGTERAPFSLEIYWHAFKENGGGWRALPAPAVF